VTPFERGLPGHVARERPDAPWQPDPLIMDERFLAAHVKGRGIAVFTACSHAGLINVLTAAQATFPDQPLLAVVGGFHLSGANEPLIEQTVQALRRFDLQRIVPGHCTGYRAVGALLSEFGDEIVVPLAVGRQFVF
jgi:7,8-dihydropterin-6-yl-methyl-4-(beta-D-ribofuranosyl)aminobenzene 5'-phosphate synthase